MAGYGVQDRQNRKLSHYWYHYSSLCYSGRLAAIYRSQNELAGAIGMKLSDNSTLQESIKLC